MIEFEIINPHDECFLTAPDFVTAMTAIALIGEGKYGVRSPDYTAPPALFGDWPPDVYRLAGVNGCEDLFGLCGRLNRDPDFNEAVAACCETIRYTRDRTSTVDLKHVGEQTAKALRGKRKFAGIETE